MDTLDIKAEKTKELFLRTIKRHGMLRKKDGLLIAISGGADSGALFDLLYSIRADWQLDLHLIHLNHCLRAEASDKDQKFVEHMARDLKFPVISKKIDVGAFAKDNRLSLEDAARQCRLQFFREEAAKLGIKKVALGHHKDDRAETVLFRILRGTGLRGLGTMKPVTQWPDDLTFIRPLIEMEKKEIEEYVASRKLSFCTDESNLDTRFARNKIRHRLIPSLEKHYNPRIKNALAHLAETVALDLHFIEDAVTKIYPKVLSRRKHGFVQLKRSRFQKQAEALRFRILQKAVRDINPSSEMDYFHWNELRGALDREAQNYELNLPNDVLLTLDRKEIFVSKPVVDEKISYEYLAKVGKRVKIKEAGIEVLCETFDKRIYKVDRQDKTCGIFDLDQITFPIKIRNRQEGDYFQPLGLPVRKKLKDFLTARKVPNYRKVTLPLFFAGENIFWVYGIEIGDRFRVSHRTRRFLKISTRPL